MELSNDEKYSIKIDKYKILLDETDGVNRDNFLPQISLEFENRSKIDFFETIVFIILAWAVDHHQKQG